MKRLIADALLLLTAAIWGLAFYFQKSAMTDVGPFLFIAARATVASLTLAPLALMEMRRRASAPAEPPLDMTGLVRLGMMGAAMFFLGATFQQTGLLTATVTNAGFITGLYVVITPLIVWLTAGRSPSPVVWAAVAMAFAGAWALGGGTVGGFSRGDVSIAICAVFWGMHIVVTSHAPRFGMPMTFTFVQFVCLALITAVPALALETVSLDALWRAGGAILYVGVLSSALTFTLLAIAMKHTPASEAAVLMSLETLFAALAGAVLLGEKLPPIGWVGAGLLFAATLVVQLGPREKPEPDAAARALSS